MLPVLARLGCTVIALTAALESPLAQAADIVLNIGKTAEACPIGMAPSVSTTVMLAAGDALALSVMKAREFGREDYARFHPGGALGRSLMRVAEVMQTLDDTAWVTVDASVLDTLSAITQCKAGAAFVVDEGRLAGVFTDGDLRRHIREADLLTQPIGTVMTAGGQTIVPDALATEAVHQIQSHRIGELPVVDDEGRLLGQVTLKDLVAMHFV